MKKALLYISFILAGFSSFAQPGEDIQNPKKREKFEALYRAYVTQQLQLTPSEAEKFWPQHEQFQQEMQAVNQSNLSDLDKEQRRLDIKKKYQPVLGRIIGNERGNRFYGMHDQFRNKLLEVRQRRQEEKAEGLRPKFKGGGMRRQNMIQN